MGETGENVYLYDFDRMCRLCLASSREFLYIFQQENQDIKKRIENCISLEMNESDGLPPNVCTNCCAKVNEWHVYKQLCLQSDITLRQHLVAAQNNQHGQSKIQPKRTSCERSVKQENDSSNLSDLVIKLEDDGDLHNDGAFSESDDTPLSRMVKLEKEKTINKPKVEKKEKKRSAARGRAPKSKPFCLLCNQKFTRFTELVQHQNLVHNMQCDGTEEGSANMMPESTQIICYRCHVCKKEFEGRDKLREHCKVVHDTKIIQPYPCSHCERQFPSWGLLVIHERKHTGDKPYSCDVCGKQNFISQTSLRRHKLIHLKVYNCKECGRDFNCDSALKSHIRCKHTNEKPYLCNICGRSFSLSAILVAHMTSHSSERKYTCDICGFASKTSGNHYRHKNTHKTGGPKSFHCETCGKAFDSKLKLSTHQIIHRPVRPHVCKMCGKAFLYNNKLERHILLVHARERPFPCSLCGKKLASKFGLGIHLKTHTRNESQSSVSHHHQIATPAKLEDLAVLGVSTASLHTMTPHPMAPPVHPMMP